MFGKTATLLVTLLKPSTQQGDLSNPVGDNYWILLIVLPRSAGFSSSQCYSSAALEAVYRRTGSR